ncbi:MAG: hypothetical protein ACE14M_15375 [Terriglobales bacterium]
MQPSLAQEGVPYHELGDLYLDNLNKTNVARNLLRRLERMSFTVSIQQTVAA